MRRPASRSRATPAPPPKAAFLAAFIVAAWAASAIALEPVYWRQRVFYIPYQPVAQFASQIEKVQLLVARDGVGEWAVLQEAEPHVRGFSYHAPVDGEYSFALRTVDRKGNISPTVIAQPQLRVVVDTTPPSLQVSAAPDATGRVMLRYEARDIQLKPETLRLEAQTAGGAWERIATGPPDVSQPDRVLGQIAWKPPTASGAVRFRAMIDDRAGNQFTSTAETSLVGPVPTLAEAAPSLTPPATTTAPNTFATGPALGSAAGEAPPLISASQSPLASASAPASRPGIEWPALQTSPTPSNASAPLTAPAPPLWPEQRTPAQLVADTGAAARPLTPNSAAASNPFGPPPLLNDSRESPTPLPPVDSTTNQGWTTPTVVNTDATGPRWVNALTFDVDYDLQTVGPWGVSKVELWATRDGGREWVSFGADTDNRSPIRVTVPAAGVYGFQLVVSGANGAAAPTPAAGTQPELVIGVDLQEPQGELQAAEIGQGTLADHLLIRWTATDENLDARPVGLFYSAEPQGPWTTIATDIDNNGQYAWRLLRQVPEKLYLRLEVRDKAGNVAVRQSPAPVVLNLPQPSGRLRSVRPVQEDPSRFRTAAGALFAAPQ